VRSNLCRRSRRSALSRRELGDEPPLIVKDVDVDDESRTTTMDDVGLDCQGPRSGVSNRLYC